MMMSSNQAQPPPTTSTPILIPSGFMETVLAPSPLPPPSTPPNHPPDPDPPFLLHPAPPDLCGRRFLHAPPDAVLLHLPTPLPCLPSTPPMPSSPLSQGPRLPTSTPPTHLDLVGSYRRQMRECDDTAIVRARGRVYVDCKEAAEEAGAVERGAIGKEDVEGTLTELVTGEKMGRGTEEVDLK